MQCSNCGTENPKKFNFCNQCGQALVAPAAAPQPTVVVIQDKKRRGVPGVLWMLLGMVLVVVLCCLVVWLGFVDVPAQLRARLPDLIGELVDLVEDARDPGEPIVNLPGGDQQQDDQDQQPVQPRDPTITPRIPTVTPGPGQPASSNPACDEDLNSKVDQWGHWGDYYTGRGRFYVRFYEPLLQDRYHLTIDSANELSWGLCDADVDVVESCPSCGIYTLCLSNGPWQWPAGQVSFVFFPEGEDCEVGRWDEDFDCESGQAWYPNWPYGSPTGCCTVGCWCNDGMGNMGCWQTCAPQCAE